ncbi:hypothetical protein [Salsipaludibacter albus]|uniref:hypothetical protein n=1 Tax=Salsipaludibacter albus TaxID=2849650 RepID=UPI001EE4D1B5|nr:hypothetical protein [Salsipaludibacter albus]MBY5162991.1 hypothetical protein [Salsipaludibacter albus]
MLASASRRHGVLTWPSARDLGMSRWAYHRLVDGLACQPLLPGAHLVPGVTASPFARIMAGVLVAGPGAVASHATALRLWGLFELDAAVIVDVTLPHDRRHRRIDGVRVHRTRHLPEHWIGEVEGIPVTSPARALRDVAASTTPRILRNKVIDAEQRGLVTLDDLRDQCDRRQRTPGAGRYRAVVNARRRDRSDSGFEADVRALLDGAGIRVSAGPVPVVCLDGSVLHADIAIEDSNVVVECDGRAYHADGPAFSRDRGRWAILQEAGRRVVWATGDMLDDPAALVRRVRIAIEQERALRRAGQSRA